MQDQVAALLQLGCAPHSIRPRAPGPHARPGALVAGELDLLYVSPERLTMPRCLDLIDRAGSRCSRSTKRTACRNGAVSDPEYLALSVLHRRYPRVPRIALTATADPQTRARS
jgi:ATP-dependent DNA helicase RecQ